MFRFIKILYLGSCFVKNINAKSDVSKWKNIRKLMKKKFPILHRSPQQKLSLIKMPEKPLRPKVMFVCVKTIFTLTEIVSSPFLKISLKNGFFRIKKKKENGSKNPEKIHMDSLTNSKTFLFYNIFL